MLVNADLPELKYADLQYLDQKLGYDMSEHDEVQFEKKNRSPILVGEALLTPHVQIFF